MAARVAEDSPLLAASDEKTITQLGFEVEDDTKQAHWVMIFPQITEKNTEEFDKPLDRAEDKWNEIFPPGHNLDPPSNVSSMTKKEFHEAVRATLLDVLQGELCGFTCSAYKGSDGLEVILRIALLRADARRVIAEDEGLRMTLSQSAYKEFGGYEVPTDQFKHGKFVETTAGGKPVVGYLPFTRKQMNILTSEFKEVDCIRLARRRMETFMNLNKLKDSGIVLDIFVAHDYQALQELYDAGWSDWKKVFQWPGQKHVDMVRDYYGEEFGFFFHWLNFFTRYLVVAGICAGFVCLMELGFPDDDPEPEPEDYRDASLLVWPDGWYARSCVRLWFSLFMCLWGAVYTKHYQQRSNFKIMEWGMKNYSAAAQVRAQYDKEYRGTMQDSIQRALHWVMVLFFIFETFGVVWLVCLYRRYLDENPNASVLFGLMTGKAAKAILPNLLITANIKFVDQMWKRLSPVLTEKENWRTDQEMKDSKVVKMFIVKFFVYYYPFWFIAFLQESWYGVDADACMEDLKLQIWVYFPTEVCCTVAMTILPLVQAWLSMKTRIGSEQNKRIKHTELQAKSPEYAVQDSIEDTMELILSFGFLMMFSTVLVVMPLLALLSNLVQIRLMAFRLSYANKRPSPRGQEGFGAWADIVQIITFAGVLCNVGLAVFVMKPLRGLPKPHKLTWLIMLEHILIIGKLFITSAFPSVSDNQNFIEEHNVEAVPAILFRSLHKKRKDEGHPIKADETAAKVDLKFSAWEN